MHPKQQFPVGDVRVLLSSRVVLEANTTVLRRRGEPVLVRVGGVGRPLDNDLIAMYAPADADPSRVVPVAWLAVALSSPEYTATGAGSVVFHPENHRVDMAFRLLRNGSNLPAVRVVLAEGAAVVKNGIVDAPSQGHLALDGAGRYVVQWVSGAKGPQMVLFGASPGALRDAAPSTAVTYKAEQMCGSPANSTGWLPPGWLHHAVIPDIPAPGSRVYYRFGSNSTGWSATYSFAGPPPPGGDTRLLLFCDVGMTSPVLFDTPPSYCPPYCPAGLSWNPGYATNSTKLVRRLAVERADVALMIGDLSYAQGFAADWDVFGAQFEAAFTRWPVMAGVGNHERDWPGTGDAFDGLSADSGGECNVPATYRFYTPASYPRLDARVSYYSFSLGNVHFLVLDSETPSGPGTPQHAFVVRDLADVDRTNTPWIVAGMHRMMAAPSVDTRPVVGDQANMARLTSDWEDLFSRHGVALVLSGHEHAYARTCAMLKGKCVKDGGIVYLLAGNAGAGFTSNFPPKMDPYVDFGLQFQNGYVRVTSKADSLLVEAVSTDDGAVFDSARLALPAPSRAAARARGTAGGRLGNGWLGSLLRPLFS